MFFNDELQQVKNNSASNSPLLGRGPKTSFQSSRYMIIIKNCKFIVTKELKFIATEFVVIVPSRH